MVAGPFNLPAWMFGESDQTKFGGGYNKYILQPRVFSQEFGSEVHGKLATGSYEKLLRSAQILRERCNILGELVVSISLTHGRILKLSH
jgi:hypothetical protein